MSRSLTLHESALSQQEYIHYLSLFQDISEKESSVSVREARGWLKGRYHNLDPTSIDKILRLFHPNLGQTDVLIDGQFYAVLRLISHLQGGNSVDPSLVFVQPPQLLQSPPPPPFRSLGPPTPKWERNDPTSTPKKSNASDSPETPFDKPALKSHQSNNPFVSAPHSSPASQTSLGTSAISSDEGSISEKVTIATSHSRASSSPMPAPNPPSNPFLTRTKSIPQSGVVPMTLNTPSTGPPLPPRKPPLPPPPRHASQQPQQTLTTNSSTTPYQNQNPPPIPAKPPIKPNKPATSPLIKQGLLAAKGAQKSAEVGLEKLRTWEVIKTSSGATSNPLGSVNIGNNARRSTSPPSHAENSSAALPIDQAPKGRIRSTTFHARTSSNNYSPPSSVFASSSDGGRLVISDEKDTQSPFSNLPSAKVARSKSLHQPNRGAPPVPPPRRKRPESVQLSPSNEIPVWITTPGDNGSTAATDVDASGLSAGPLPSAIASLSKARSSTGGHGNRHSISGHGLSYNHAHDPMASLQRTFQSLHLKKTLSGLESARAKVEGKLVPGGYSKWGTGGEGLLFGREYEEPDELSGSERVGSRPRSINGRSPDRDQKNGRTYMPSPSPGARAGKVTDTILETFHTRAGVEDGSSSSAEEDNDASNEAGWEPLRG